jgi:hypothetical protein
MLDRSLSTGLGKALTSLASGDSMCDAENLGKVSDDTNMLVSQGTHAASTYDRIVPTRFPHNNYACKEPRSYSKNAEDSTRRHSRDDHLIGSMA